jgi:UDP-GlcNAc3NAcA epimerase
MSGQFFEELDLVEPDYNLGIGSGSHGEQTGKMLIHLEEAMIRERPGIVVVYGDTNSTAAAALAAAKLQLPVAHVEAGLRSFNRRMPEEINRLIADQLAEVLFTPTEAAERNLEREGFPRERIFPVGDVMYDAALYYAAKAAAVSQILQRLQLNPKGYVLATIHRAENTDEPARLQAILDGLAGVASEVPVVFPVHPRTRGAISRLRQTGRCSNLRLIEPVGYLDMIQLERHAGVIATDSGGVQKEAYFHGVPCVTLRTETEWVELVAIGANELCSAIDSAEICRSILGSRGRTWSARELYGDGATARRIAHCLKERVWM